MFVFRKGMLLLFNIVVDLCVLVFFRFSFLNNRVGFFLWIRFFNLVMFLLNIIVFIFEEFFFKYFLLLFVIICCCNCCLNFCNFRCVGLFFLVLLLLLVNKDFLRVLIS